ncbi:hypothetical protein J3F83DRAFT_340785 [Trichoderma novae-zelandiae]
MARMEHHEPNRKTAVKTSWRSRHAQQARQGRRGGESLGPWTLITVSATRRGRFSRYWLGCPSQRYDDVFILLTLPVVFRFSFFFFPALVDTDMLWRSPSLRGPGLSRFCGFAFLCAPLLCAAVAMDSLDVSRHILPEQSSPLRSSPMTKRTQRENSEHGGRSRTRTHGSPPRLRSLTMSSVLFSLQTPPLAPSSDALLPFSIICPSRHPSTHSLAPPPMGDFAWLFSSFTHSLVGCAFMGPPFVYLPPTRVPSAG